MKKTEVRLKVGFERRCDGLHLETEDGEVYIGCTWGRDKRLCAERLVACWNACAEIQNPAAIPDVVEACKELLYTAENADETGYVTDHGFIDMDALFLKVRTALAKLEGGEG